MNLRDRIMFSRRFVYVVIGLVIIVVASAIILTTIVARNAYLAMRLSDICPDYFSYEYAYVVDEQGKGMDSVAVMLRDNSNVNMIYRTFTDSTGRFVLFHDFGSFALYNMPFSYYLFVSTDDGWKDTVRYTFEKYRVCHFRKIEGPDTIVCKREVRSTLQLQLEKVQRVMIDSGFHFAPWNEMALSPRAPLGGKVKLPFDAVQYTSITVSGLSLPFAVISVHSNYTVQKLNENQPPLTEGIWYLFDRDGDRDLTDETPCLFISKKRKNREIIDCTVRACRTIDSVRINNRWYWFELRLQGMQHREPILRIRRADAITGMLVFTTDRLLPPPPRSINTDELFDAFEAPVSVDTLRYKLLLWDRALCNYEDPVAVVLAIDRNRDGKFDGREGSVELYEQAAGRILFDRFSFVIDTISEDGRWIFCNDLRVDTLHPSKAMAGIWSTDFNATATCPVSLYQECTANKYVVLYFFEGNARRVMEASEIGTFISLMRDQLGTTRLIGVNRRMTGDVYSKEPVINENRGWQGALVQQFHNHRDQEIVCFDTTATIVYRGEVGPKAITAIWAHAGIDDVVAVSLYEQQYADRVVEINDIKGEMFPTQSQIKKTIKKSGD